MTAIALVLHSGESDWAETIRSQVRARCEAAYFDPALVECREEVPADLTGLEACVYLASSAGIESPELQDALEAVLAAGVLAVPVRRTEDRIEDVVPEALRHINALTWEPTGHDVAAYLLEAVGLTEAERKLFISYRRDDSAALAEQLWIALAQRGFDVFLDRFAIPAGADVQRRIDIELSDMAFLLVVESPGIGQSIWVEYEYVYAISRSMGLRVLSVPGTQPLVAFEEAWRHRLKLEDLTREAGGQVLTSEALQEVIRDIEANHDAALVRRKERIFRSAEVEASTAGWRLRRVSDWSLVAMRDDRVEVIRVTPRSPRPLDLLRLDRLRSQLSEHGAVPAAAVGRLVHAATDTDPMWNELNEWVAESRQLETTLLAVLPSVL